jgi:putative sterol carrier protein
MSIPKNLTLRQTLEGMPLTFNPQAADGLKAIIQFDVSGSEPGVYHLRIANGECHFYEGAAQDPTMTIITPSEVWLQISRGEMTGYDALMQERYTATGEITLLMKMDSLFGKASEANYVAPASQRPAGPIPLKGMDWLAIAFVPWIMHWITFHIPGISHWFSVGFPLLLAALIVIYRLVFSRSTSQITNSQLPTFMEWGGLGYFSLAAALALTSTTVYVEWGSVLSSLAMAGLWLASLQFAGVPLSADYSKWGFVKALWKNSMFIYPNAVISLMWGGQFFAASILGVLAILLPEQKLIFTVMRYLLLVPAFVFTANYQKRAPISNAKFTMSQIHSWAGMGLLAVSGLLLAIAILGFSG